MSEMAFQRVPIKYIADVLSGGTPRSNPENWDGEVPFITPPDLNGLDGAVVENWGRTLTEVGAKSGSTVTENAVLISCRAPVGHIGTVKGEVSFNQGCKSVAPLDVADLSFISKCLVADRTALQSASRGTTFTELSTTELLNHAIPWPKKSKRLRIADYLDRETSQIDAMIEKLADLEETLRERRTGVIDDQIIGSLDWGSTRLGRIAEAITGLTYSPSDVVESGGTVVHRSGSVQNSKIVRSDLIQVATEIPDKLRMELGDILVCSRNGSAHLVGKNAVVGEKEVGETWGAFMTVLRSPYWRYIFWYLHSSLFDQERSQFSTSTVNQLTIGMIQRMDMPFPPREEQRRIADHLDDVTSKIDTMLAKAAELKDLLTERRAALITDVVTGRKDVA